MTQDVETFHAGIEKAVELSETKLPAIERLLRRSRRLEAIEAGLRDDPGHDVTGAVCGPTQDRTKAVYNFGRMGRALLALTGPFDPGECRVCGCVDLKPCNVSADDVWRSCGWFEGSAETLCDNPRCVETARSAGLAAGPEADRCDSELRQPDGRPCVCGLGPNFPHACGALPVRESRFVNRASSDEPPDFGPGRWE